MKYILSIGCTKYALKSHKLALGGVQALAEAERVQEAFSEDRKRIVYHPEDDDGYVPRVELKVAADSDFVLPKPAPKPAVDAPPRRQINHRAGQLQLPATT